MAVTATSFWSLCEAFCDLDTPLKGKTICGYPSRRMEVTTIISNYQIMHAVEAMIPMIDIIIIHKIDIDKIAGWDDERHNIIATYCTYSYLSL